MMLPDSKRDKMATTGDAVADVTEECDQCGAVTPHTATVKILTESTNSENAQFSREPYRVSECTVCGASESTRMNNA